jgi:hypothetical protein
MRIKFIFLIMTMLAASAQAQEPWPQERPDQREQVVINEDGGRAFIIKPSSGLLPGVVKPGGPAVGDLQQHSIFLGHGWADPALRTREPRLSNLLANIRDQPQLDEIEQAGIKNRFGATFSLEKLDITGDRNISDLQIQDVLAEMFRDGPLTEPTGDEVYVVYLDAGLHSTLGSLVADKHYMAYHGFFNVSGAKIHYAVVPFQPDSKVAYQIALRALVVAALNPTGSSSN